MKALVQEKKKAISLRKKGYSYKEILKEVNVAKSSLSLWLKDLPLTKDEKQVLKKRKDVNISRGRIKAASELRKRRLNREKIWLKEAKQTFLKNKTDPQFHTGIALYWAEGGKRTDQWQFSNSDYEMINVMLSWIEKYLGLKRADLRYRLYIHKPYAHENFQDWWAKKIGVTASLCQRVTYKPTQLGIKKRPNYKGCFSIEVPRSKGLLCKMQFWTDMLVEHYKKQ